MRIKLTAHKNAFGEFSVDLDGSRWTLREMVALFIRSQGEFGAEHYGFIHNKLTRLSNRQLGMLLTETKKRYSTIDAAIADWYPQHYELVDLIADELRERFEFPSADEMHGLAEMLPQMKEKFHVI